MDYVTVYINHPVSYGYILLCSIINYYSSHKIPSLTKNPWDESPGSQESKPDAAEPATAAAGAPAAPAAAAKAHKKEGAGRCGAEAEQTQGVIIFQ